MTALCWHRRRGNPIRRICVLIANDFHPLYGAKVLSWRENDWGLDNHVQCCVLNLPALTEEDRQMNSSGQPTRYKPEYCELAHSYCLLGAPTRTSPVSSNSRAAPLTIGLPPFLSSRRRCARAASWPMPWSRAASTPARVGYDREVKRTLNAAARRRPSSPRCICRPTRRPASSGCATAAASTGATGWSPSPRARRTGRHARCRRREGALCRRRVSVPDAVRWMLADGNQSGSNRGIGVMTPTIRASFAVADGGSQMC